MFNELTVLHQLQVHKQTLEKIVCFVLGWGQKSIRGFAGTPDFPIRLLWVQISNNLGLGVGVRVATWEVPHLWGTTELEEHREEKQHIIIC